MPLFYANQIRSGLRVVCMFLQVFPLHLTLVSWWERVRLDNWATCFELVDWDLGLRRGTWLGLFCRG